MSAKPTKELIVLADDDLVHLDFTTVTELEREVGILQVVVPAAQIVS